MWTTINLEIKEDGYYGFIVIAILQNMKSVNIAELKNRLRAADALQLAAALVWCRQRPHGRAFVVADDGLSDAAEAEGFTVIRLL